MQTFTVGLTCVVTLLSLAFILAGRLNRRKFRQIGGFLVAEYAGPGRWFCVGGYYLISFLPFIFAASMKEGDPLVDRIAFILVHAGFLLAILYVFNRRIVVGKESVGVATIWGAVRIIDNADLAGARIRHLPAPLSATIFATSTTRVWVDDDMQHHAQVVAMLSERAQQSVASFASAVS